MAQTAAPAASRIEADDGLYLEVKAYFTPDDTNAEVDIGNVTQLTMETEEGEKAERISNQIGTSGLPLDIIRRKGKTNIAMTFDTFRVNNIAMAVMGLVDDVSYTVETVVDKDLIVGDVNRYMHVGHRYLDRSSVEVKDNTGTVVDPSMLEINERMGNVMLKEGGTVVKGDTIKVSYTTLSKSGFRVRASKLSSFKGRLRLEAKNLVNDKEFEIEIFKIDMAAGGSGINWAGSEFQSTEMTGTSLIGGKDLQGNVMDEPYHIHGEYAV